MVKRDNKRRRPLRITIIGILSILDGLIFLFPVFGKYGLGDLIILSGQTFQEGPFLLTASVIAVANLIIGIGCLYGWRPVWFYLIVISAINFMIAAFVLYYTDAGNQRNLILAGIWFAIAAYGLLVIQSRKARTWFRI
jgi:hypothetical protein